MNKILLTVLLTLISQMGLAISINQTAPDFSLKDEAGKDVKLSDFKGKTVVLEWTNHQCPFVKKHYETNNMQSLQKKFTAQDVVWLSIVSSAPGKEGYIDGEKAKQLTEERKAAPTKVLLDPTGKAGQQYQAKTTPHMYIVNPEGTLVYMGGIDNIASADKADVKKAENYIDMALTNLLAGKAVKPNVTRPYGCSVKY